MAVACCALLLLTRALLMTSSHSKANYSAYYRSLLEETAVLYQPDLYWIDCNQMHDLGLDLVRPTLAKANPEVVASKSIYTPGICFPPRICPRTLMRNSDPPPLT